MTNYLRVSAEPNSNRLGQMAQSFEQLGLACLAGDFEQEASEVVDVE